jgi:hypothetical protein
MHEYRVVERLPDSALYVLQCNQGRYHVARALNVMPPVDVPLRGCKPSLGFGVLLSTTSGEFFRVIFESVDDPHPAPDPNPMWRPAPGSKRTIAAAAGWDD